MDTQTLRALLSDKGTTLAALRAKNPALAQAVSAEIQRDRDAKLTEAIADLHPEVRNRVRALDPSRWTTDLEAGLREAGAVPADIAKVRTRARASGLEVAFDEDAPLATQPVLATKLATAAVHEVGAIAGLPATAAEVLVKATPSPSAIDHAILATLVSSHQLTSEQAMNVGLSATVFALAGENSELAAAIRAASFPALGGNSASTTADLIRLTGADWAQFFSSANFALPEGTTAASAGAAMAARFASLDPTRALVGRLPVVVAAQVHSVDDLQPIARAYPGLGLSAVLADPNTSLGDKAALAVRRTGFVQKTADLLGETNVLRLDLSSGAPDLAKLKLDQLDATPEEQAMVVGAFRTYQRVFTVAKDIDDTHALVAHGFTDATSIGKHHLGAFLARSGLPAAKASAAWQNARLSLADASLTAAGILDRVHGLFDHLGVSNDPPTTAEYLKQLAGYQELFGKLSFCDCEECQSILGPAAYFVDLMKFIDDNLRDAFAGKQNHPLDLKTRRPDLWTLELSCNNTNNTLPTLDVVDEVVENYIAQQRLGYTGSLADRTAIAGLVYRNTLTQSVDSFAQPFHLPWTRIKSYLAALGHSRTEIAASLAAPAATIAQAELDLSPRQLELMVTAAADLGAQRKFYDVAFAGTATAVADVDAQALATAMALARASLGELIDASFVAAGGAHPTIQASKRSSASVQNDVEWVKGLTADALDRMHRFVRATRATGWTIRELDLVLTTLGDTQLNSGTAQQIASMHAVQKSLGIAVDELCGLVGELPDVALTDGGTSLFDRLLNPPSFVASDGELPKPTAHFIHPEFREHTAAPVDPALARLTAGLSVDLDGLAALARHLAPHLAQETNPGFDPAATHDDDRYFVLSSANLTLLYRHARLARLLGIGIDQLFQLLELLGLDRVTGRADLVALLDLNRWQRTSGYSLDDLAMAGGQAPLDPTRYPDPAATAAQIVVSAATALEFTDTVFAVAVGTTEQGSADLVAQNPAVIEPGSEGHFRLVAGVDLNTAAIAIPTTATVATAPSGTRAATIDEIRTALRPYLAAEVLSRSLGAAFGVATEKAAALAALAGQSLTADSVVRAVRGDGAIAPLTALVSAVIPLTVAFASTVWDAAAIDFVRGHTALFTTDSLPHTVADALHPNVPFLSVAQVRALSMYAQIATRASSTTIAADLQSVLTGFDSGLPGFPAATDAAMARVLGVPAGLIAGLRGRVIMPATAAPALDQLDRAAALALSLGVDGETLGALVSANYDDLSHAADALGAALANRFTDEKTRATQLDLAEQPVREAKRDGLAAYLIHSITPKLWSSLDDLYQYFLIDIAAGGCATTSRVVAATMSAQLYVHRVLMNLEQDGLSTTDANHVALTMPADAALEWDWRKNYRVWQANRQVFLWPENYMIPNLRDDKTPLFEELEQELLQTDISDDNVFDAYTKYLAGFEEVASLTIAGAYHDSSIDDAGNARDVLHLFGTNPGDPPTYYYRTCENLKASARDPQVAAIWSPWHKIAVQITGRKVSPIIHNARLHLFWTDVKTRSINTLVNGASEFSGYRHTMSLKFTTLRPDGKWTAPQSVLLPSNSLFWPSSGSIEDPLVGTVASLDPKKRTQTEALDDYTLSGPSWDWVWPQSVPPLLKVQYRNWLEHENIDLFKRTARSSSWSYPPSPNPQLLCAKAGTANWALYYGTPTWMFWPRTPFANAVIDETRLNTIEMELPLKAFLQLGLYTQQIATIPTTTELLALPNSEEDALLQIGSDLILLSGSATDDATYVATRLGTTLVDEVARRLFEGGIDSLLDTNTQLALAEAGLPITLVGTTIKDHSNHGKLDFKGAYGVYYQELYFHIPFLIADALNSRGRYESAQTWYHYIFNPTSTEVIDVTGVPAAQVAHRLLDRVWRYREFRGHNVDKLRSALTDETAIALYKKDPFNPWAIARRRVSAFQKTIVMRYVDNLLDWADSLFTQFTMESVNEALMLYIAAQDILGQRPTEIGDCGEGISPMTYEKIGPLIESSSEIFIELETLIIGSRLTAMRHNASTLGNRYLVDYAALSHAVSAFPAVSVAATTASHTISHPEKPSRFPLGPRRLALRRTTEAGGATGAGFASTAELATAGTPAKPGISASVASGGMFSGLSWSDAGTAGWAPALSNATIKTTDALGGRSSIRIIDSAAVIGRFGWNILTHTPVFCVPANADLLAYWDRVEDRLYKIRHCLDIDGQRRSLALFAPPINPMQLVAMRAAGLSLDDVLGATNGNLPPYRFLYLIDRAKAFAAALSGFGASLLTSLEKKDAEELNRLRLTHQMNLLQLTSQIRQLDIRIASESLESLNRQRDEAKYRSEFYAGLVAQDRNGWEIAESITRHLASSIYVTESVIDTVAAILSAMPDVGSPFAMKYGGVALGSSTRRFGNAIQAIAEGLSAISSSMSLEGNFARRSEGWTHQKALADYDTKSLDKQIAAAAIRLDIANRSLDLHQKTIDQLQDVIDLTDGRFTNLGLYTWMVTQLQRLYRGAYQNALAVAKLAEQAYRFERGDDTWPGLTMTYWDPTHAGLFAGDQLLIDLQTLERRYLETNYRSLEVDQAFALSQIDAGALIALREAGECTFTVNEAFFDLFYPGHYKRRIKAVRLTIPCVTGPYVNVSATLNLERSWIRSLATPGGALVEVPPSRSVSIATSTGQNDAGVFELSFRDERYMPFEGLGAVSQWKLTLPKAFRQFDYQTINDVILSISYTAEQDGVLRERVEAQNAALAGSIVNYFTSNSAQRVFSLRRDFSTAFTRLLRSPAGTAVKIELTDRNFPLFVLGRNLQVTRGVVLVATGDHAVPTGFSLSIDGTDVTNFAADPTLGNLPSQTLPGAFSANLRASHTISVTAAGSLAPASHPPGDVSAIDASALVDILLFLEYRLA